MFTKASICVLLLTCGIATSLRCDVAKRDGLFTCNYDDRQIVSIFDQDFRCPTSSVCNHNYVEFQADACNPCIGTDIVCGTAYKCLNDTTFSMGATKFTCPDDYACNYEKKTGCNPCVQKACKPYWTCVDDRTVIVSGVKGTCPTGKICNKNNVNPCMPCIVKPTAKLPSFLLPTP